MEIHKTTPFFCKNVKAAINFLISYELNWKLTKWCEWNFESCLWCHLSEQRKLSGTLFFHFTTLIERNILKDSIILTFWRLGKSLRTLVNEMCLVYKGMLDPILINFLLRNWRCALGEFQLWSPFKQSSYF